MEKYRKIKNLGRFKEFSIGFEKGLNVPIGDAYAYDTAPCSDLY